MQSTPLFCIRHTAGRFPYRQYVWYANSEGELLFMMKKNKKQTAHAQDAKKINVTAVILYLLIFLIFLAAEGMIALYCYVK